MYLYFRSSLKCRESLTTKLIIFTEGGWGRVKAPPLSDKSVPLCNLEELSLPKYYSRRHKKKSIIQAVIIYKKH